MSFGDLQVDTFNGIEGVAKSLNICISHELELFDQSLFHPLFVFSDVPFANIGELQVGDPPVLDVRGSPDQTSGLEVVRERGEILSRIGMLLGDHGQWKRTLPHEGHEDADLRIGHIGPVGLLIFCQNPSTEKRHGLHHGPGEVTDLVVPFILLHGNSPTAVYYG